jgi:hypothetical protein
MTPERRRAIRSAEVAAAIAANEWNGATVVLAGHARSAANAAVLSEMADDADGLARAVRNADHYRDACARAAGLSPDVIEVAAALLDEWHGAMSDVIPAALALS